MVGTTEAALLLGICSQRLRKLLQAGRISGAVKVGRHWRIPLYDGMPRVKEMDKGAKGTWRVRSQQINSFEPVTYEGGCHCGAVRFQVTVDKLQKIDDCNCSICRKKGFLHLIVPQENFTLLQGEEALTTYTFNTKIAQHKFCKFCGIHSFYIPRSHPHGVDVNVRCLDENVVDDFEILPFDGANWEANIHKLRT